MIHTIGDSHSMFGWSDVQCHYVSSMLCYTFGKNPFSRFDITTFGIQDGDSVVFCFGEIDCRCHIHKHVTESISYTNIIDDLVSNYFDSIKASIVKLNKKLKHICVYNIVPTCRKSAIRENPDYPHLGSDEERRNYTSYFNKKVQEKCLEHGYVFFDVYNKYCDSDGYLNMSFSDGHVHIKNGIYISEFIRNNLS